MLTTQHMIEDSSSVSKATGADKSDSKQVSKRIILNATILMIHAWLETQRAKSSSTTSISWTQRALCQRTWREDQGITRETCIRQWSSSERKWWSSSNHQTNGIRNVYIERSSYGIWNVHQQTSRSRHWTTIYWLIQWNNVTATIVGFTMFSNTQQLPRHMS